MKKLFWMVLPMLLVALPVPAAEPVAMVTDIAGQASLTGDGNTEPLTLLAYLIPGSKIEIGKGSKAVITYFSNSWEYVLSGPAKLLVGDKGLKAIEGAALKLRKLDQQDSGVARRFSAMQRERLSQATFEMRAARIGLRLIGPVDTPISTATPEFTWSGPGDADGYHFTLSTDNGNTIRDVHIRQSSWQLPEASALKYGRPYRWQVETTLTSGETLSASGSFSVLDRHKATKILKGQPGPGADFSERVLYAVRLETEGLKYDAMKAWQALARERPDNPVLQEKATR